MGRVTVGRRVTRIDVAAGSRTESPDKVAVEEPLELRIGGEPLVVTMRTPGHDVELLHGFLLTEGIIASREDVLLARYCAGSVTDDESGLPANTYNVMDVTLAPGVERPEQRRSFPVTSACGVCGKDSIDALRVRGRFRIGADRVQVAASVLTALPGRLSEGQAAFAATGGLHAAGLFTAEGDVLVVREDVGRHNAVDKVIGWALMNRGLPLAGCVLQVSGRTSFEIVQKAYLAGIPVLSAVSAPSSLAVATADEVGMTLCGFVRGSRVNVYTHPDRIGA